MLPSGQARRTVSLCLKRFPMISFKRVRLKAKKAESTFPCETPKTASVQDMKRFHVASSADVMRQMQPVGLVLACFFLVYHTILVFSSILEEWVIALASEAIKVPVPSGPNVSLALIRRLSEMHLVDETRSATPSRLVTKLRKTKSENVSSSDFHHKKRP